VRSLLTSATTRALGNMRANGVPMPCSPATKQAAHLVALKFAVMVRIETIECSDAPEMQELIFGDCAVLVPVELSKRPMARLRSRSLGTDRSSGQDSYGCYDYKVVRPHDLSC
jgi:hypothetical protein